MQSKTVTRRSLNLVYLRDALDLELCAQTLRTNPENFILVSKKVLFKKECIITRGRRNFNITKYNSYGTKFDSHSYI